MRSRVFERVCQTVLVLSIAMAAPAVAQVLSSTPAQLQFTYVQGSNANVNQSITINSDVTTTVTDVSVTYGSGSSGWLAVAVLNRETPANLTVYVSGAGLAALQPGTYLASINVSASPSSGPLPIAVLLAVTPSGSGGGGGGGGPIPQLTVSPATLSFSSTPGSGAPAAQTLAVAATDNSGFVVGVSTLDGASWLSVNQTQFTTTPANLTVSVNPAGLTPGVYSGTLALTGIGLLNVPVTLTVGSSPFTLTPASLTFNVPQNFGISAPQYVNVATTSPVQFAAYATSDSNWIQTDISTGTTPALLGVRINAGSLGQGTYTGKVTVQQGPTYSVDVPVTLVIGPPAVISIAPSSIVLGYTVGDPGPITQTVRVNAIGSTPQTFTLSSGVLNGSGWLTATASTLTTPSTLTITIDPTSLSPGNYVGSITVTPTAAGTSPQQISVAVTVTPAPTPVITFVQNAASAAAGTVAPGELVTLVGRGLGPRALVSFPAGTSIPTTLGNTTVTFDGVPAPIIYASSTATTVQVPYTITPGTPTTLQLTYTTSKSATASIPTQAIYPGLFSSDASGKGQAAVLNEDLSVNAQNNPAKRGSLVVLYGTGEGVTTPALKTGSIVSLTPPFPQPAVQPVVFFNGVQGSVVYAGEAPGSVSGLFQINVRVPTNISAGTVSVQAAFGGQATQSGLTIAVQ